MFNNSSQFPHQSFEQFKQLKFVFDDASSPKQQSPVKPYEQSLSKPQQKANPPSKQKGKTAAQPAIPSHSFGSGSKGMAPQRAADPFDDSIGPSSATNAYAQSLSSSTGGVRLQDLCPEDKQKIGELIKKLAEEKDEKEKLRKQLETKDDHYKGVIDNLTKENEDIVKNASELQNEFRSSLSLLKSFQESTSKSQSQRQKSKEHKIRQQRQHEEEEDDLQFSQSQPYGQFSQSTSQRRDRKTKSISNNPDDLTMSYLDKGETLRESKERFSPLKDASQRSRQPEFRTQEKPVHKERHIQEAKPPKNKGNVIETLKKEQKAIDEISRLKEDIEGLASSFKKINFSPVESFGAKENEAPRGHQPVFENKHESPIKLIQNYNTSSSEKQQRYDRGYQEHYSPPRQPKSPTQQAYYQESFGKQPSGLKASGYSSSHKQSKQEEKGNSSSDDDEVAIAQKWLNLRKQKIQQINKELNKEKESPKQQRHIQDSQRHEMYYTGSDEKRRRGEEESLYQSRRDEHMQQRKRDQYEEYDQDEERYRMEQEIKRLQMQLKNERRQHQEEQMNRNRPPPLVETQSYRKQQQQYPQQRFEEIEDRDQYGQTWRKNSPPVREVRSSGGFSSATMSGGNKLFSKQASGSASNFQQEALSPTGVVNLNKMSVEDLMNLKNVLDERIRTEKPEALRQHREEYIQSPSRAFMQPQTQQRHDDVFGQRAYMPKGNLSPKLNTMETDSHFLEKLGRSGQKTFQTEDYDYERRLAESTIHGRTDAGVDMSLMRDFNSIGNTPANRLMTEEITFPTETPMTQKTEGRDLDYESLYEEKLKEFLKVRERMVKSNKIKDNGLDIEEILKSTLLESKRTNNTVDPHTLMSMHKYTYTNSPATARSFGKPEPPKLSSRDLMLSPPIQAFDKQRHPLQSTQHAHELPEYRVPTFESEPKKQQEFQFMTQPRQIKSPVGKKQMEPIEELGQLADDFYDDGLFDLVDDIEKKGSTSAAQSSSSVLPDSKTTSSRNKNSITNIDDEFKTLFTTVKTMFSPNDDTTTDRIREQLFGRSPKYDKSGFTGYDKSGLTGFNTSKLSYDDEDVENESILNLPAQVLNIGEKGISRKTSGQRSNSSLTQLKTSKNDVSAIESDASMLVINKKINEMKKKKKPMKF